MIRNISSLTLYQGKWEILMLGAALIEQQRPVNGIAPLLSVFWLLLTG